MSQYNNDPNSFEEDFSIPSAPVNPSTLGDGGYPGEGDLYKLFWNMATLAGRYDSDDADGTDTQGNMNYFNGFPAISPLAIVRSLRMTWCLERLRTRLRYTISSGANARCSAR